MDTWHKAFYRFTISAGMGLLVSGALTEQILVVLTGAIYVLLGWALYKM